MATKIIPTVGRVMWFYPSSLTPHPNFEAGANHAAMVAAVINERTVNVSVLDRSGAAHAMQNVAVVQEGEDAPSEGGYVSWMPFQLGQAAAAEKTSER